MNSKLNFYHIIKWFFIILMIGAGVNHFLRPHPYFKIIPQFLPAPLIIVYISGIVEILLGAGLLLNKSLSSKAAIGIFILMIFFLPLHIWDMFRETPAIGSKILAYIRFPLQLLFIYLAYNLYKKLSYL